MELLGKTGLLKKNECNDFVQNLVKYQETLVR